ncbi:Uma2 family endonuclease [Micromonospora matsumotoense]|uniref:Uma2 family endonuclease n=1 Tax=Micromonospora matsumotoense TaxID=121616 RepID=UPI003419FFB0
MRSRRQTVVIRARHDKALWERNEAWTARRALDLVPPHNGPRVEVLRGSVVISPDGDYDQRTAQRELTYLFSRSCRPHGWVGWSVNLTAQDDLLVPHLAVLRQPGRGRRAMPVEAAVLLGEIGPSQVAGPGVIDRPREYAAAGVPFFLRVDLQNRIPTLALYELADGEYRPTAAAAAGTTFVMTRPFAFSVDPAELLDEAAPLGEQGEPVGGERTAGEVDVEG